MRQTQSGAWIDFRALRSQLDFRKILEHYDVKLRVKGNRGAGRCPLPTHQSQRKSSSFSVDLSGDRWQCFSCKAGGNMLDFACRMEGMNPSHGADIRKAALLLQERFHLNSVGAMLTTSQRREDSVPISVSNRKESNDPVPERDSKIVVNPPIDFELQTLDFDHPYLRNRGFTDETIRYFGLGFCNRGMLKHRIAIPLHDAKGRLVGYAGRLTEEKLVSEANPKYRFPGDRERDDVLMQFRKTQLLYNAHRIRERAQQIVVLEGFASVWWLHQHGWKDVVALMGSDCSDEQAKLTLERVDICGQILFMPDGDDAGRMCARSLFEKLAAYRFVRWVKLENGKQPTDYDAHDLEAYLTV